MAAIIAGLHAFPLLTDKKNKNQPTHNLYFCQPHVHCACIYIILFIMQPTRPHRLLVIYIYI